MGVEFRDYVFESADVRSLRNRNMNFLLSEAVDRSAYAIALKSIEPLSEIEDLVARKMPATANAIRKSINDINRAVSDSPDPIVAGTMLDDSQRNLVNATTKAEILKFAMLNAMDGLRMLFISEFKSRESRLFSNEALMLNASIISGSTSYNLSRPRPVPFSQVESMEDYVVLHDDVDYMVIKRESTEGGGTADMSSPFGTISLTDVTPGKIYVVGKEDDGSPVPIDLALKSRWLGVRVPTRGPMYLTISEISTRRGFDIQEVVQRNFKVPRQTEGLLTSIYRAIRSSTAISVPYLSASTFADEVKDLKLQEFKKIFEKIVEKTTSYSGDLTTLDLSDVVFFTGLSALSGALGLTREPTATATPPTPSAEADGAAVGGEAADSATRRHSLKNVLMHPEVVAGSTDTERAANLGVINQDALRRALNRLVGRSVTFTEGTVDRWCELAGLKG